MKTQKDKSNLENRNLAQFPHFTFSTFLDSTFQTNFSNALCDQFIGSQTIKRKMNKLTSIVDYKKVGDFVGEKTYLKISSQFAIFDSSERLVYNPLQYSKDTEEKMKNSVQNLSHLANGNTYFYYVNDSNNIDFTTNKKIYDIDYIFAGTNYSYLDVKNYDDLCKYFYKTDHHWNNIGAYQGYLDIANLLGINSTLRPTKETTFDLEFRGSIARLTRLTDYYDSLSVYSFDIPEHTTILNEEPGTYGSAEAYFNHNFSTDLYENHYGSFYGSDYAEIILDFNDDSKENLLILSNSFSNSINELVASHFNKTYIVDFRRYAKYFKTKIDLDEYIKEHNIDKVLFIGHYNFYAEDAQPENLK